MSTFIKDVVLDLVERKIDFSEVVFVLPSKRAGTVLQHFISSALNQTIFSPTILSIEEFVQNISGLEPLPQTEVICKLYDVYLELTPKKEQEPFQTFISWATTLVEDINEVDRHVLDHNSIFGHLSAIQETDHWSNTAHTTLIKNYLLFWNQLPKYYSLLSNNLLDQNQGHQGLLYRKAAEEIEFYIQRHSHNHHVFVGFNALNTSEELIIQALLATGKASAYWDAEAHFMNSSNHNASQFLRKHKTNWPYFKTEKFNWINDNYTFKKEITCTAVPENIDQVKYLSHLLSELPQARLHNTAIVLGEENLIIPLLNSLPSNVQDVNITMGIPLDQTPISSFFKLLFDLQLSAKKSDFYHKDITSILKHSLASLLLGTTICDEITEYITRNKRITVPFQTLLNLAKAPEAKTLITLLFTPWDNTVKLALKNTSQIISQSLEIISHKERPLLVEYLQGFKRAFIKLENLCQTYSYIDTIRVLERFYSDIVAKESVDLRGNPHQGLQIMGMLESRLLDFENVYITSVNEGVLPSGKSTGSYFPYDLKLHYGLPTYADKDAIYTYHFYRLLHRSSNINILYTTAASGLGSSEKSRLILQLEAEGVHALTYKNASAPISQLPYKAKHVFKTPALQKKIYAYFESGISPSAIGSYLRNPLDFYYQYILRVRPPDLIEETIASNTLGTIVHNVLETLYLPYKGKTVSPEDIVDLTKKSVDLVDAEFKKETKLSEVQGQNLIIYKVIQRFIDNFFAMELNTIKGGAMLQIHALENKLEIPFTHAKIPFQVKLKGTVDRVDIYNNRMRIIDYKTGTVKPGNLTIKDWEDLLSPEGKYEKAFQVLFYTYLQHKTAGLPGDVTAGIISTKKIQNGFMSFKINNDSTLNAAALARFEEVLTTLLLEIANPEIPFEDSGFSY